MRKLFLILSLMFSMNLGPHEALGANNVQDFDATSGLLPLNNQPSPVIGASGPVLIQFWASWCQRCSSLFEELSAFTSDHSGLSYLAVSIDKDAKEALA